MAVSDPPQIASAVLNKSQVSTLQSDFLKSSDVELFSALWKCSLSDRESSYGPVKSGFPIVRSPLKFAMRSAENRYFGLATAGSHGELN